MYVLKGGIFINIGGEHRELTTGDSIHFRSTVYHKWGSNSDAETHIVTIVTVPVYDGGGH